MKTENLLLDQEYALKVADFGMMSTQLYNMTPKGTNSYMAPEIHMNLAYSGQCVDLFAAGIVLF